MADWLRELRQVRIDIEVLKIFRDGFKEDAQKYKAENERLRELCADMLRTMKHTTGPYIQTNHYTLLTKVFRDGKPTNVMVSLTSLEERYEQRFHELGIEARDD